MALPTLPTTTASLSFSELKTHFGNAAYPPDNLSNYYGAESSTWVDPDAPNPTMVITAAEVSDGGTSSHSAISLTFTSNSATTNFAEADIVVSNGALTSFAATSSTVYTATFTAVATGATTIDVAAGSFTDSTSGQTNTAAAQFNWTTTSVPAADTTGRLVVFYRPLWTSTSYRGDYQLNTINITGEVAYTFDSSTESWEYKSYNSTNTSYTAVASAYSGAETWTAISTATTSGRFNRHTGGTGSGSTGLSGLGSYYIYAETSGTLQGFYGARSPEITIASGSQSMVIQFGSYGSNCGPCYYYWMPTDNSNKTLIYTDAATNSTSIQNHTVAWTAP